MKARLVSLTAFLATSCTAQQPAAYPGNVDGVRFLIPASQLMVPALYDDESDWTPPIKPKTERTFLDRLSVAELAKSDETGLPMAPDPPGTKPLEHRSTSISYDFWPKGYHAMNFAKAPGKLLSEPQSAPDQWGLKVLKSNAQSRRYDKAFDREYFTEDGTTRIACSSERMLIEPFSKLPDQCTMFFNDSRTM